MKVIELFAGTGSQHQALKNLIQTNQISFFKGEI